MVDELTVCVAFVVTSSTCVINDITLQNMRRLFHIALRLFTVHIFVGTVVIVQVSGSKFIQVNFFKPFSYFGICEQGLGVVRNSGNKFSVRMCGRSNFMNVLNHLNSERIVFFVTFIPFELSKPSSKEATSIAWFARKTFQPFQPSNPQLMVDREESNLFHDLSIRQFVSDVVFYIVGLTTHHRPDSVNDETSKPVVFSTRKHKGFEG